MTLRGRLGQEKTKSSHQLTCRMKFVGVECLFRIILVIIQFSVFPNIISPASFLSIPFF